MYDKVYFKIYSFTKAEKNLGQFISVVSGKCVVSAILLS
jgi:hypothetical protein